MFTFPNSRKLRRTIHRKFVAENSLFYSCDTLLHAENVSIRKKIPIKWLPRQIAFEQLNIRLIQWVSRASCDNVILAAVFYSICKWHLHSECHSKWTLTCLNAWVLNSLRIWNVQVFLPAQKMLGIWTHAEKMNAKKSILFWFKKASVNWKIKIFCCHNRILAVFWANCSFFPRYHLK